MIIRPFDGSDYDYAAVTAIHNAVYPEQPHVEANARQDDAERTEKYKLGRLLAIVDGVAVGEAYYLQQSWSYRPGKFMVKVQVMPDYRGRGIGTALYDGLMAAVAVYDPTYFYTYLKENHAAGIRFAEKQQFAYAMRYPFSHLDLTTFDAAAFAEKVARFEAAGYTIRTLTDLKAHDPEWGKKLHPLVNTIAEDVPSPEPHVWSTYEEWLPRFEAYPTLIHDAYFVALDGERWVGLSFLLKDLARPDFIEQGLTGTLRDYRCKGIATALKVVGSQWAQASGYTTIETDNEENNPMYALNMQLGYRPQPAQLEYIKPLSSPLPTG